MEGRWEAAPHPGTITWTGKSGRWGHFNTGLVDQRLPWTGRWRGAQGRGPRGGLVSKMYKWARGVYLLLRPGGANATFQLVLCPSTQQAKRSCPNSSCIIWSSCPGPPTAPTHCVLTRQRGPGRISGEGLSWDLNTGCPSGVSTPCRVSGARKRVGLVQGQEHMWLWGLAKEPSIRVQQAEYHKRCSGSHRDRGCPGRPSPSLTQACLPQEWAC